MINHERWQDHLFAKQIVYDRQLSPHQLSFGFLIVARFRFPSCGRVLVVSGIHFLSTLLAAIKKYRINIKQL